MSNIHEAQEQSAMEHERNSYKMVVFFLRAATVVVAIVLAVTLFVISLFI
jgi:hypothetical protein